MSPRGSSLLLVVVAALTMLGHVCVGPLHAHAGAATAPPGHDDAAHGHDAPSGDDAAHGGSCEALRATPTFATPAVPTTRLDVVAWITGSPAVAAAPVPTPHASPPLFLLHAVLLI